MSKIWGAQEGRPVVGFPIWVCNLTFIQQQIGTQHHTHGLGLTLQPELDFVTSFLKRPRNTPPFCPSKKTPNSIWPALGTSYPQLPVGVADGAPFFVKASSMPYVATFLVCF